MYVFDQSVVLNHVGFMCMCVRGKAGGGVVNFTIYFSRDFSNVDRLDREIYGDGARKQN